ncbi:MAG: DnaD domain protein [Lachnospiraceae bacterium]|nr:DnaD domain protein [Lachnospiraceae bacterium]
MGTFNIYQDNYADFTVVSNHFIDEYMEDANDAQLKIYLYLTRMLSAHKSTGISDIADRFNYTEKDVMRALRYWEKKKVLSLDYDSAKNLTGVHMLPLDPATDTDRQEADTSSRMAAPAAQAPVTNPTPVSLTVVPPVPDIATVKPQYTADDLSRFKTSQLIFVAEQYLHKTLTPADLNTLMFISQTLHFSDDLADFLLQYCVGRGKTSHRYIEKVAIDWAQSGIKTPEQAAAYVPGFDNAPKKTAASSSNAANKFNNITQNTYDFDALEKALISN